MRTNISRNTDTPEGIRRTGRRKQRKHAIHKFQTYLLEFATDGKIYSISFLGKILPEDIRKMLKSLQNCLYADMAGRIMNYLKQNHLAYKNFTAREMPLDYGTAKNHTNMLLHSASRNRIDKQIGEADIYYGIMDCQQWKSDNCCEGCYLTVKRVFSEPEALYQYKIIGQIFHYNGKNNEEESRFAIRASDSSRNIYTISSIEGRPVIPTFGCVGMIRLLLDIDAISTPEQTEAAIFR